MQVQEIRGEYFQHPPKKRKNINLSNVRKNAIVIQQKFEQKMFCVTLINFLPVIRQIPQSLIMGNSSLRGRGGVRERHLFLSISLCLSLSTQMFSIILKNFILSQYKKLPSIFTVPQPLLQSLSLGPRLANWQAQQSKQDEGFFLGTF